MIKIERILCPTDLSPASNEALRYAVALAREYSARLILCHCVGPARGGPYGGEPGRGGTRSVRMFEGVLAPHLGLTDFSQLDWEGDVIAGDDAGTCITREAAWRGCDLIVMRSRRRPHAAALLGSTAEAVCRTAPCSVLVTHPNEREWVGLSAGDVDLGRVLVAHDYSDCSELALQYGLSLTRRYSAELHLLHVLQGPEAVEPEAAWVNGASQALYHASVRRLHEALPGLADRRPSVKHTVLRGRPYDKVLTYASENEIDLICMGADGVGRGVHALFGSNVDRVIRQSPCPVLVARPLKPAAYDGGGV